MKAGVFKISRIEDLQKQLADKQKRLSEQDENDRRNQIKDDINDRKDALKEQYDLESAAVDDRLKLLEKELDAAKELFEERTKNDALQVEALNIQVDGLSEEEIKLLYDYEDKYGEGLGIMSAHAHNLLNKQLENWNEAYKDFIKNISLLNMDSDFIPSLDLETISALTEEQKSVIEKMKANSEAWKKATTDAERNKLAALNESLGAEAGFTKDLESGIWYLDEDKTQELYKVFDSIKTTQVNSIQSIIDKHKEEHEVFTTYTDDKIEQTKKLSEAFASVNSSGSLESTIAKMKLNSDAWAKATTDEEKQKLSAQNESLGYSAGLYKDSSSGIWYLDEAMTQKAYDALELIKETQTQSIDDIKLKYEEDLASFNESNDNKTKRTEKFITDTKTATGLLYDYLKTALTTYESSYTASIDSMQMRTESFIESIQNAISHLDSLISLANSIADVKINIVSTERDADGNIIGSSVTEFHTGGKVKVDGGDEGLLLAKKGEIILDEKNSRVFENMVEQLKSLRESNPAMFLNNESPIDFGKMAEQAMNLKYAPSTQKSMLEENFGDIDRLHAQLIAQSTVNNSGDIHLNFNLSNITKDTAVDFEKRVVQIIKKEGPEIIAANRMRGANNLGYTRTR